MEKAKLKSRCLTEAEAADYIGMSRSFLRQDRMYSTQSGNMPRVPYIKIGRNIRYWADDLSLFITDHRVAANQSDKQR